MKEQETLLTELKKVELDILKSFIDCCAKLGLNYYLMDGTLLGAVRHKGFIPWDDDIDVGMLRRDYEVFVNEAQKILPTYYFLQTTSSDKEYLNSFAKIRDSRTTFIEKSQRNRKINHGIYIDIFPLDYFPQSKFQQMQFKTQNRLLSLRIRREYSLPDELRQPPQKEKMQRLASDILCIPFPNVKRALDSRDRLLKSINHSDFICNFCGGYGYRSIVPYNWFSSVVPCKFESLDVSIPVGYVQYLTAIYGDYMTLPPIEKRTPHHYAEIIDATKPYNSYVNP